MTLEAVGTPLDRLRQKNCPAAYFRTPLCVQHSTQHLCTENEDPFLNIHRYQTQHFTLRPSFAAKRVVGKGCCVSEILPSVFSCISRVFPDYETDVSFFRRRLAVGGNQRLQLRKHTSFRRGFEILFWLFPQVYVRRNLPSQMKTLLGPPRRGTLYKAAE